MITSLVNEEFNPSSSKRNRRSNKNIFRSANMIREFPEINSIPPEYVENLFKVLTKYPEYNRLTLELVDILNKGENILTRIFFFVSFNINVIKRVFIRTRLLLWSRMSYVSV